MPFFLPYSFTFLYSAHSLELFAFKCRRKIVFLDNDWCFILKNMLASSMILRFCESLLSVVIPIISKYTERNF